MSTQISFTQLISAVETGAHKVGIGFIDALQLVEHVVLTLGPVAGIVGTAIGNPAVTAAASLATAVATQAEPTIDALGKPVTNTTSITTHS